MHRFITSHEKGRIYSSQQLEDIGKQIIKQSIKKIQQLVNRGIINKLLSKNNKRK